MKMDDIRWRGGERPFPDWVLLKISGKDREAFLQGQVTSEVKKLPLGSARISTRLDLKGRVQSFFYIYKRREDLLLLVPEVLGKSTQEDLEKFVIMEDVTIEFFERDLSLVMGPVSVELSSVLKEEERMVLDFYEGPAMVYWGPENSKKVKETSLPFIDEGAFETLRILSGFPRWGVDIDSTVLVNETYLEKIGVDYHKGCFLGQETANKIRSHRGPSYFPVLLVPQGETPGEREIWQGLKGKSFFIEERKGGVIQGVAVWEDKIYVKASLYRQFRVENRMLNLHFKGDPGLTLTAKIRPFPFFKGHGREEKALELYEEALRRFTYENRPEEAISLLRASLVLKEDFADAYESLGVILGRGEKYKEAITVLKKLTEVDPRSVMAHTNLSLFYMKLGDIEEAEKEKGLAASKSLENYLEKNKKEKEKDEQKKLNEEKQAQEIRRREEMFRQVLEIDPEDPVANYGIGDISLKNGDTEKAIEFFQRALQGGPHYSVAFLGLGKALELSGQREEAKKIYLKGVEVAAGQGELMPANEMQTRLDALSPKA